MTEAITADRTRSWGGGKPPRPLLVAWTAALTAHVTLLALLLRVAPAPPPPPMQAAAFTLMNDPVTRPAPIVHQPASAVPADLQQLHAATPPTAVPPVPLVASASHRAPAPYRAATARPRATAATAATRAQAATAPTATLPRPPQAAPAADISGEIARLSHAVSDAVQRNAVMPLAARQQGRQGRAQVRFDYLDGTVDDVILAQSSASRLLDHAAVEAVRTAHYPPAPAALRSQKIPMQVWVDFELNLTAPT
jgi:protein TonB